MKTKIPIDVEITSVNGTLSVTATIDYTSLIRRAISKLQDDGREPEQLVVETMSVVGAAVTSVMDVCSNSSSVSKTDAGQIVTSDIVNYTTDKAQGGSMYVLGSRREPETNIRGEIKISETGNGKRRTLGTPHTSDGLPEDWPQKLKDTPVASWTSAHFQKLYGYLYKQRYNTVSFEVSAAVPTAKLWSQIKFNLIDPFTKSGFTRQDIYEYLEWVFKEVAVTLSYPVTLSFVFSRNVISRWIVHKHGTKPTAAGKDKWSKLAQNARNES